MMTNVVEITTARQSLRTSERIPSSDPSSLSDANDRARALDITRSWIVEAPAGSGKTGLLIQRYLALLASPALTAPEQVVAITFTRAATEEVRSRILRQLREAESDLPAMDGFEARTRALAREVLLRDRQLDWRILEQPRRLRVQTIDGLCAEIVRSLPALAGGVASLRPTEDAEPLFREAAQRALFRLGQQGTPEEVALSHAIRDLLLHRDGDLGGTESLLADMLAHREQWSELISFSVDVLTDSALDQTTLPRLNRSLRNVIRHSLSELVRLFPPGSLDRLAGLAAELALAEPHRSQAVHPLLPCRDLLGAPTSEADLLEVWHSMLRLLVTQKAEWRLGNPNSHHVGVDLSKDQRAALKEILSSLRSNTELQQTIKRCLKLPPAVYPEAEWTFVKALFRVLHAAVVELGSVFQEHGRCDFAEFSIVARQALASPQTGTETLDVATGIQHLLVDEVQDTSSRQYDLLKRLTCDWDGRSRTLFLVGDPKQSIYIFRQARVERFVQIMESHRFGDLVIEPIHLSANFRSQAGLVSAANTAFEQVFHSSGGAEDLAYTAAVATRPPSDADPANASFVWHLHVLPQDQAEQKAALHRARGTDAQTTHALLESWIARPLPPGRDIPWRMAVLVQNRKSLDRITRQLRSDRALPFSALDIEGLGDRREILDLLSLTRALLHPADRIAWLALLRAPWCGLMLADLHQLTGADDPSLRSRTVLSLLAERIHSLSPDGAARLSRVTPVLQRAIQLIGELRFPDLVERTWRSLGGNQYLDETALENVRTLLRLLRAIDYEQGFIDYDQLQRRVDKLRAAPSAAPAQIDLMTIHGAKGLEWDAVFLPELDRAVPPEHSDLLLWEELSDEDGILLAPMQHKGDKPTALQSWLLHLRNTRLEAERRRLFYVAATRGREQLHLFGCAAPDSTGAVSPQGRSLLRAAWPAAECHLPAPTPEPAVLSLAASADDPAVAPERRTPVVLERVPAGFQPFPPVAQTVVPDPEFPEAASVQPHAAPLARAIGNVVHSLLEYSAIQAAAGISLPELAHAASTWRPRVHALLRDQGIGPQEIVAAAERIQAALQRTLSSALGQWILSARPKAHNELGLTTWDDEWRRFRIDRVFLAGPRPLLPGTSQLWIVDYKTSSQGSANLDSFLESEQSRHREQLERYATLLHPVSAAQRNRTAVGLWFPLLGKFLWWHAPEPGTLALSAWHIADDTTP